MQFFIIFFLPLLLCILSQVIVRCSSSPLPSLHENKYQASITIDTTTAIAEIDDHYICATMDYATFIPETHCSLLNLDLNNPILKNAVKAFTPLILRLGGTLEDVLVYETVGQKEPCMGFVKNFTNTLFGFNQGCLSLSRWDQLNYFFKETGAAAIFGLNALYGKRIIKGLAMGHWNSSNAESLIRYTVNKGYNNIFGWELGNELSGVGVGATIQPDQYADDVIELQKLVQDVYSGSKIKPIVAAPGGFFNAPVWFAEFISKTAKILQVITHHIYTLGPGEDSHLIERIFDPSFMDGLKNVFNDLQIMLKNAGSSAVAWVGEAGGAWHGGHDLVTNVFASSFWFLDQLAIAASYNTKTFCRQTLIWGHYGLLNTTTFVTNPDYYSALLWHRLMAKQVLATKVFGTPKIRAYTLCSRQSPGGITLLILNLDDKAFKVSVSAQDGPITGQLKQSITREEYHLTSPNGNIRSQTLLLNGQVLSLTQSGDIPQLRPQKVDSGKAIKVDPYSCVFAQFSNVYAPACKS